MENQKETSKSKIPLYREIITTRDELETIHTAVSILNLSKKLRKEEKTLRPRNIEVLSFFILYGFSKETKKLIQDTLDVKPHTVAQNTTDLVKAGAIYRDMYNQNVYHVNQEYLDLKDFFLEKSNFRLFCIQLQKNNA